MKWKTGVIAAALLLAALRILMGFTIDPEPFTWVHVYKTTAHIFIGVMLTPAWIRSPVFDFDDFADACDAGFAILFVRSWISKQSWQWWLFWGLNAVEVSVAVLSRM